MILRFSRFGPRDQDSTVFLSFANFDKRFIKNFSKIVVPFTLMLQTTDNNDLSTKDNQNEKNQDAPDDAGGTGGGRVNRNIKNLLTAVKSTKSKKQKLIKPKKSDLIKAQNVAKA